MSKILFRLNGVSDDEAEEVRELLASNNIDFYETSPGNWGVSMPAIGLEMPVSLNKHDHYLMITSKNEASE